MTELHFTNLYTVEKLMTKGVPPVDSFPQEVQKIMHKIPSQQAVAEFLRRISKKEYCSLTVE